MAASEWLGRVVREWATALNESGFTKEEAEAARHYIDMEYSDEFEYSRPYMALRAFFLTCEITPGADQDEHILSSSPARMVVGVEAAYRMGYADAQKQAKEKGDGNPGA